MIEGKYQYFAFISYQRRDEEWADGLRNKLEHYHLPSNLRKQDSSLPKEIRPIFRDGLELAGGVLAEEIQTALQQSKFLIVVCSPNSAQSPWVNKEVQTFIDLGREAQIIPYIIDGTPFSDTPNTECFPPALRSLRDEKELLGININEMGRDAASVKVVSRMFGLRFDTLWQRYEREKKRKRLHLMVFGTALIMAVLFVAVYIGMKNEELKKSNWLMLENRDRFMEKEIRSLIDSGDCYTACRLLLYLLPENLSNPDKPYLEKLEFLLRTALSNNNAKIKADWVGLATFSPNGKMIAENGSYGTTIIWDAHSGAKIREMGRYYYGEDNSDRDISVIFSNDSKTVLTVRRNYECSVWNISTGEELAQYPSFFKIPAEVLSQYSDMYRTEDTSYSYPVIDMYSPNHKRFLRNCEGFLYVENIQSDNLKISYSANGYNNMKWSHDYKYVIGSDESNYYIWDYATGATLRKIPGAMDVAYTEESIFALFGNGTNIKVIDCINDTIITELSLPSDCYLDDYEAFFDPLGEKIVVETGLFEVLFYDAKSGELLHRESIPSEGGFHGAISADGRFYAISGALEPCSLYDINSYAVLETFCGGSEDCIAISDSGERFAFSKDSEIRTYVKKKDEWSCIPFRGSVINTNSISFSHNSNWLVSTHEDGIVRVWNCESGTLLNELKGHQGKGVCAIFTRDDRKIVSSDNMGVVKVWSFLPFQELMDKARKRFKNNPLTQEECRQYYLE